MPLSLARAGETNYIRKVMGNDALRRYLSGLGLVTGEKVTVISEINGSIILSIKNSRIALDRNMANLILV
ncbi:MAG TPA: ferrous iron transport protein A [Clostridiaceae bacterium]|nr:ferrous iron transport protein A [Clostridiaceae bacterium]